METLKYFPEGIAMGEAFLNRTEERTYLISRIKANKHSVLIAPRRYGKTSLVMKVAEEMKLPYCAIDLLAAYSTEYVRDQIADKVSRLVFQLLPKANKAKESLITIFKKMKPEISLGAFGQHIKFNLSNSPLQDISELLLNLDETAKQFNKKAVIFMDEFQQISQLKNNNSIEASIRHAVERSENVAYVFSGSHRQLLTQMFGHQGRPLYQLCQTIGLERMSKEVYKTNLMKLSKQRWKNSLNEDSVDQIFECTELHPFYTNVLCQLLWEQFQPPSPDSIKTIWHDYVKTQRHVIANDVLELSINQRKILSALAKSPASALQSTEFGAPLKLSASSIQLAVEVLIRKDMVLKGDDHIYRVLDPAIRYYLNVILWED